MRSKKIFLLIVAFGLLTSVFTSCQKDSVTLRLRMASFSHDGKVHMDGLTPKWDADQDLVCVNGETCTVSSNSAVSVSPSIDYKAVYPASICVSLDNVNGVGVYTLAIPEIQVYKTVAAGASTYQVVEAPMGAHSNTSAGSADLYFKNLGALLAITVSNGAGHGDLIVDKIIVTSDSKPLWGSATLAMPYETTQSGDYNPSYVINESNDSHRSVTLAGNANGGSMNVTIATNASKQFYISVPAFSTSPSNLFTFEVQAHNNSGEGIYRRAQLTSGSGNIPLNQIGSLTFELTSAYQTEWNDNTRPAGALRQGEFTIDQSGHKVYFSAGNLQYKPSAQRWRIAENQWDYVGYYNPGPTTTGAVHYGTVIDGSNRYTQYIIANDGLSGWTYWIDLFGWGTSGYNGVTDQAMPYDYVTTDKVYGGTAALDANYDWGKNNTIYNFDETGCVPDDNHLQHWRTLTKDEWNYLLGNGNNLRSRSVGGSGNDYKGLGHTHSLVILRVDNDDIPGLLIYPDDYSDTDPHPSTHDGTTTITQSDFLRDYSSCAFLPCAGIRSGAVTENGTLYPYIANLPSVPNSTPIGYYWTADYYSTSHAGFIQFPYTANNLKYAYLNNDAHRYKGCSVRLVYDVQ